MRLLKASRGRSFLHNHKQLGEGSVNGRLQDDVGNAGADLGPSETVVLANVQEKGRRKSGALALVVGKARVSTRPLPRPVASPAVSGFSGMEWQMEKLSSTQFASRGTTKPHKVHEMAPNPMAVQPRSR